MAGPARRKWPGQVLAGENCREQRLNRVTRFCANSTRRFVLNLVEFARKLDTLWLRRDSAAPTNSRARRKWWTRNKDFRGRVASFCTNSTKNLFVQNLATVFWRKISFGPITEFYHGNSALPKDENIRLLRVSSLQSGHIFYNSTKSGQKIPESGQWSIWR